MAYKFQLGDFAASGSILMEGKGTATDDVIGRADIYATGSVYAGVNVSASADVQAGAIETRTIGHRDDPDAISFENQYVAFANNVDVDIMKTGGLMLGGASVTSTAAELNNLDGFADATYAPAADSIVFYDADDSKFKREAANDFTSAISAGALTSSAGVLGIKVDDASIQMDSDHLQVKALGVTNGMLAGSIANAKLSNSAVTVTAGDGLSGGGSVALGSSVSLAVGVDDSSIETNSDVLRVKASGITDAMLAGSITAGKMQNAIFADLETLGAPSSDGEFIVATGAGAFAYESGATVRTSLGLGTGDNVQFSNISGHQGLFSGKLEVQGDLYVAGETSYVSTTNTEFSDSLIGLGFASGSNDHAAGDRGFIFGLDSENDVAFFWDETASQFALATTADALNVAAITPVAYSDLRCGAITATSVSATLLENVVGKSDAQLSSGVTLAVGDSLVCTQDLGGSRTVMMPASANVGDSVQIKLKGLGAVGRTLTIEKGADAHQIDGGDSIILESPYAAVKLVYVAANDWRVY